MTIRLRESNGVTQQPVPPLNPFWYGITTQKDLLKKHHQEKTDVWDKVGDDGLNHSLYLMSLLNLTITSSSCFRIKLILLFYQSGSSISAFFILVSRSLQILLILQCFSSSEASLLLPLLFLPLGILVLKPLLFSTFSQPILILQDSRAMLLPEWSLPLSIHTNCKVSYMVIYPPLITMDYK